VSWYQTRRSNESNCKETEINVKKTNWQFQYVAQSYVDSFLKILFEFGNHSFKNVINSVYSEMFPSGHLKASQKLIWGRTPNTHMHVQCVHCANPVCSHWHQPRIHQCWRFLECLDRQSFLRNVTSRGKAESQCLWIGETNETITRITIHFQWKRLFGF